MGTLKHKYRNVPFKPRFEFAKVRGRKFFNSLLINEAPIDPFGIIKSKDNWSYILDDLEGEEGYTLKRDNIEKYKICIDTSLYGPRVNFTAAHEIGHIILNHFIDFDYYNLTEQEEFILDKEADTFAGELLMPRNLILQSKIKDLQKFSEFFNVSKDAMEVRLKFLGLTHILDSYGIPESNDKVIVLENYKSATDHLHNKVFGGDKPLENIKNLEELLPKDNSDHYKKQGYPTDEDTLKVNVCPKCYSFFIDDND
ncbi:ImmA/IrrE family metallo-endopeptidase, partial [Anaerosolibacter sp.]|uniref:ImmA/IrrE family metallo-endopeptidase n=1 Tax=Anaerosolibacter sp. TaxID=1872527 RepID=UPI0039EE1DAC